MGKLSYYVPGVLVILTGILILAVPQILVALVAASVILVGISFLYHGHMAKRADAEWNDFGRTVSRVLLFRDAYGHPLFWR